MDEFLCEIPVIEIKENNYSYVDKVKKALGDEKKFLIVSEGEKQNGIVGFTNCIKQESGGNHVR